MKHLTILVVLIAVTGVNLVFRNGLYNPVSASRGPEQTSLDRVPGVERVGVPDLDNARPQAALQEASADLSREADRDGDVVLARIAAECGNHLFDKARRLPDHPHLLNQAAHHYRACLSHEPTCRAAAALFRDVRARLEQVERLLARRDADRSAPAIRKTPAGISERPRPATRPAVQNPAVNEAPPAAENPAAEKDEGKMVGPDGVIYQRNPKR